MCELNYLMLLCQSFSIVSIIYTCLIGTLSCEFNHLMFLGQSFFTLMKAFNNLAKFKLNNVLSWSEWFLVMRNKVNGTLDFFLEIVQKSGSKSVGMIEWEVFLQWQFICWPNNLLTSFSFVCDNYKNR